MRERSGTDEQIESRIRRGDHVRAIRDELGCGNARINRVAARIGLDVKRVHKFAVMDNGEVVLKAQTTQRRRPNLRLTLPEGWAKVHVVFPVDDDGVITIRKVTK
jgi:hypothetical protein